MSSTLARCRHPRSVAVDKVVREQTVAV